VPNIFRTYPCVDWKANYNQIAIPIRVPKASNRWWDLFIFPWSCQLLPKSSVPDKPCDGYEPVRSI